MRSSAPSSARALALLACSAWAASCRWPSTSILVRVSTDIPWQGAGARLTDVRLYAWRSATTDTQQTSELLRAQTLPLGLGEGRYALPGSFTVSRPSGGDGTLSVVVVGLANGVELVRTAAIVRFVNQQTGLLELFLADRCIAEARLCRPDQTCGIAGCELAQRAALPTVNPRDASLPPLPEAGPPPDVVADAMDASTPDAAPEAATEAAADAAPLDASSEDLTRPFAPLSSAVVSTSRPTLRWRVGAMDRAPTAVRLCRDRAMSAGCLTAPTAGVALSVVSPQLTTGAWFWQLQGTARGALEPVWQLYVMPGSVELDVSYGSLPDFDGDGLADLVVAAPRTMGWSGRVLVYRGTAGGWAAPPTASLPAPSATDGAFGVAVRSVGDLDGDGFPELAVGAMQLASRAGAVYVYQGSAAGLAPAPRWTLFGVDDTFAYFGAAVAPVGDVNGDGYGDFVVGAHGAAGSQGRVHLFLGGPRGPNTTPSQSLQNPDGTAGRFGVALDGPGDTNGDGLPDLVVGAYRAGTSGRVWVYQGSGTGFSSALVTLEPTGAAGSDFGSALVAHSDLDGDGRVDLAVGAPMDSGGDGSVYVYLGTGAGFRSSSRTFAGVSGEGLGTSLGVCRGPRGVASLLLGGPLGASGGGNAYRVQLSASASLVEAQGSSGLVGAMAALGSALGCPGDGDGDGFEDLALGAPGATMNLGRVLLFAGGASGFTGAPRLLEGVDPSSNFGGALGF